MTKEVEEDYQKLERKMVKNNHVSFSGKYLLEVVKSIMTKKSDTFLQITGNKYSKIS